MSMKYGWSVAVTMLGWNLISATPALADDPGIPLTIRVVDEAGSPIPTAVVRHPNEQDRHRVNTELGTCEISVLYMPDGSELFFEKGMTLDFEISAPGYENRLVTYTMRKRKNTFDVALKKMTIDMTDEAPEDIVIPFIRDKPID